VCCPLAAGGRDAREGIKREGPEAKARVAAAIPLGCPARCREPPCLDFLDGGCSTIICVLGNVSVIHRERDAGVQPAAEAREWVHAHQHKEWD
jgi:hypothetical protein